MTMAKIDPVDIASKKIITEIEQRAFDLIEADHRLLLTALSCNLTCIIACTENPDINLKPRALGCFNMITSRMAEHIIDHQLTINQTMRVYAKAINYCTTQLLMIFAENYTG